MDIVCGKPSSCIHLPAFWFIRPTDRDVVLCPVGQKPVCLKTHFCLIILSDHCNILFHPKPFFGYTAYLPTIYICICTNYILFFFTCVLCSCSSALILPNSRHRSVWLLCPKNFNPCFVPSSSTKFSL